MISNTTKHLNGVWGSSENDVFAVGNSGTLLHYDGNTWETMTIPTNANLNGVWGSGPDHVYAIGAGTILHYDGAEWTQVVSCEDTLRDIHGIGPGNIWAVGEGTVLHFNGLRWDSVATGPGDTALLSVWVGTMLRPAIQPPPALVYIGDSYGRLYSLGESPGELRLVQSFRPHGLCDIWGLEAGHMFFASLTGDVIALEKAKAWTWHDLTFRPLRSIYGTPDDLAVVVGDAGAAWYHTDGRWHWTNSHAVFNLRGVWLTDDGAHAFAVGANGTIQYNSFR